LNISWLFNWSASPIQRPISKRKYKKKKEKQENLLLRPNPHNRPIPIPLQHHPSQVLAAQRLAHVAEVQRRRPRVGVLGRVVQRKLFVVRGREDFCRRKKPRAVDRAVVEGRQDGFVFVCDECVGEVEEAVG
jgi:hypothetical protein